MHDDASTDAGGDAAFALDGATPDGAANDASDAATNDANDEDSSANDDAPSGDDALADATSGDGAVDSGTSVDAFVGYGSWKTLAAPSGAYFTPYVVWTGSGVLVYEISTAAKPTPTELFDPTTNSWRTLATWTSLEGVTWTGTQLFTFGYWNSPSTSTSGIESSLYDLATNKARDTSLTGRPSLEDYPVVAWAGDRIVTMDDGDGEAASIHGGLYDPKADLWTALPLAGAPLVGDRPAIGRTVTHAVWTGTELLVWSSCSRTSSGCANAGAFYSPSKGTWRPMSTTGAPLPANGYAWAWNGAELFLSNGAISGVYSYATDTWTALPSSGLAGRNDASAVWTGSEFVLFGGDFVSTTYNDGARWVPSLKTWRTLSVDGAPPCSEPGAAWTGTEMVVVCSQGASAYAWTP